MSLTKTVQQGSQEEATAFGHEESVRPPNQCWSLHVPWVNLTISAKN